ADRPGDEPGGRPRDGEAQRGGGPEGQADPLPPLGRQGGQPPDHEPERPALEVRVRGVLLRGEARGEGARRLEVTSIKLTLEYDGGGLVGWQTQPNGRSVQEELGKGSSRPLGTTEARRTARAG